MRVLSGLLILVASSWAGDAYFAGSIGEVEITQGTLPPPPEPSWPMRDDREPRVVLDGPGEAYVIQPDRWQAGPLRIALRIPERRGVEGTLVMPNAAEGMVRLRFRVAAERLDGDPKSFREVKRRHYLDLWGDGRPGGAWFRHQAHASGEGPPEGESAGWGRPPRDDGSTFDFFTGGTALAENLQLARDLPGGRRVEATVPLDTIPGIRVAEFDWEPYLRDKEIETDALAALVPADQYTLFFPSFVDMLALMDLADESATPVLHAVEMRAQDARTRARYERQLCLRTDALSRALGPHLIDAVAFTGSDPFLRDGTDVAVLFGTGGPEALAQVLQLRRKAAAGAEAREETRTIAGHEVHVLSTPDRAVHSLMARAAGAVVVSNSALQMERILSAGPRLAQAREYLFFRSRYARGAKEETALLVVPDAAIRKWCGPRWRIAASRRVRALAVLAELEAEHCDAVLAGATVRDVAAPWAPVDCGELTVAGGVVRSSRYNTRDFLTPIAEMEVTHATPDEARFYGMWRDGYERNWSNFFDPIAVRFSVAAQRVAADVTVMPLIAGSDYAPYLDIVRGARIAPEGADRHEGALIQFAIAVDSDSATVKAWGSFLQMFGGKLDIHPLGWLGESVSIYLDRDVLLEEAARAKDPEEFLEENYRRMPVALHCAVKSPMQLAAFLTTLRAFAQQSAPRMLQWDNLEHGEQPYVRVRAHGGMADGLALYYVTLPDAFVVTLNEELLRRAIDRLRPRADGEPPPDRGAAWLGDHLCLRADRSILAVFDLFAGPANSFRGKMRSRSWGNLAILNEWKRRYPDRDPVEVHESLFGVRLVCPGGGRYVWDGEWHTISSTAFGHPAAPLDGPADLLPFAGWRAGNFGLTFEKDGLRAVCEVTR